MLINREKFGEFTIVIFSDQVNKLPLIHILWNISQFPFLGYDLYEFPLAPMGVLAPGSAHARPSAQPPINMSGYFPAHVSAESPLKISPNLSEVISEVSEP